MDEKNADAADVFVANRNYPDAKGLFFDGYQTLEEIRDVCTVVLDTNALLVPFGISKSSLSQIVSTYTPLAQAGRLVIPGQVAREFAKNRPVKIGEIFQAISRKRNLAKPDKGRYPLLDDAPSYAKLRHLEEQIGSLVTEYHATIGELLSHIQSWVWDDPVSKLYSQIFPEVVVDLQLKKEELQEQLVYLQRNKIPPGYKDAAKDDQGVGDLLVWQVVVHVAEERKQPVVFVSGDTKADWFYRSENQPLFPRFELVDEIRRVSDGKSLHIVPFSKFLELFGATADTVGEVRSEEIRVDLASMSTYGRTAVMAHVAEQAVSDWIEQQFPYPGLAISRDDRTGEFIWSEKGGAVTIVTVKYFPNSRHKSVVYHRLKDVLDRFERKYDSDEWGFDDVLVFLVFESGRAADETTQRLPEMLGKMNHQQAGVVVAHLPRHGALRVQDPLNALPQFS